MEIGLLLQWFTLRRITMLVVFSILAILTCPIVNLLNIWVSLIVGFINGILLSTFIQWNFKENDYGY